MATIRIIIIIIIIALSLIWLIKFIQQYIGINKISIDYQAAHDKWLDDIGKHLLKEQRNGIYKEKLSRRDVVERSSQKPVQYMKKYIFDNLSADSRNKLLTYIQQYSSHMRTLKVNASNKKNYYYNLWYNLWNEDKYFDKFSLPAYDWDKIDDIEENFYIIFYSQTKDGIITTNRIQLTSKMIDELIKEYTKEKKVKTISSTTSNNTISYSGATPDFIKEQRNIMNRIYADGKTLRDWILERDNYTCKYCGNSRAIEPNLLLEVDHIHPVSKWGPSIPENLQTLCWKCNREKSNKES